MTAWLLFRARYIFPLDYIHRHRHNYLCFCAKIDISKVLSLESKQFFKNHYFCSKHKNLSVLVSCVGIWSSVPTN